MDGAPVRLVVIHGPNLGHEYSLQGEDITIGRSPTNNLVLPFPEISRKHARIWQESGSLYLEDLGSTNGTYVNNVRLYESVILFEGDEIQIGDSIRLLCANPSGVTKPITLTSEDELAAPQSIQQERDLTYLTQAAASEIPTPKPPLSTSLDEEVDASGDQVRRYVVWLGCSGIIMITCCFLALVFLDSYEQGRLLYCGPLNSFFQFLLGPFGFNPICP